jgi:hypothetical protein
MTGHLSECQRRAAARPRDPRPGPARGVSPIGTACAAHGPCPPAWSSIRRCCARICRTPRSLKCHARAVFASGWAARGSMHFWVWMSGACRSARCSTCPNAAASRKRSKRRLATARLLVLDVVSPAPRFGLPERDGLNAQIVILPMTDADLAPTRALYLMGAVAGDIRATDPPHRWCATANTGCRSARASPFWPARR